jgi:1-acyl-sn-glycerol-3-phosphate acyltransferase
MRLAFPTDPEPWLQRDPQRIRQLMPVWAWLYRHYFRVQTSGWEQLDANDQVLVVGSHNGGLASPDLPMAAYDWFRRFGTDRPIYGLAHAKLWQGYPWVAKEVARVGAIPYTPRNAMAVLDRGHSLLIYPGGGQDAFRPHRQRDRIHLAGRTGFLRLAIWYGLPIVPLISWGSHDTLIVLDDLYPLARRLHALGMPWVLGVDPEVLPVYLGLPWGLALGPLPNLPLPVPIHTRVCAPIRLERTGHAASRDKPYVQACYLQVVAAMQAELDQLIRSVGRTTFCRFRPRVTPD